MPETSKPDSGIIESSDISSVYANVFEVQCLRSEIVMVFGTLQGSEDGCGGLSASLTNRIILAPRVTRQLMLLLREMLQRYESLFGELTGEVDDRAKLPATRLADEQIPWTSEETAEKADSLIRLVDGLETEYGFERSFKLSESSLLANRYIMGFKMNELEAAGPAEVTVSTLFRKMGMPDNLLQECIPHLSTTEFVHFGFEEQSDGCLYKAYLEFKTQLSFAADGSRVRQDPFLVFLGFKWNTLDHDRSSVSRYTCFPLLTLDEIHDKLDALYEGNSRCTSLQAVRGILENKVRLVSANKVVYIEVTEDGNPRKSFDLNLYGACLRMDDIHSTVLETCRRYSLKDDQVKLLLEKVGPRRLGHISGGVDRAGNDFLTLYYGVEGVDHWHR